MNIKKIVLISCGILLFGMANAFNVTIIREGMVNGKVMIDNETAEAGEIVTLTILPDSGYELETLLVYYKTDDSETIVEKQLVPPDRYTFEMPDYDVTVTASFKKTQATLNAEAVEKAKTIIENEPPYTVAQATANTESDVIAWLLEEISKRIDESDVLADNIKLGSFKAVLYGIDGSFEFCVSLSKGDARGEACGGGTITATQDHHPKTCIKRKGNSNILICEDATDNIQYAWGFIDRSTQKEDIIENEYTNYQYFQFDHINTEQYEYFVEIIYSDSSSTRTFYPTNKCEGVSQPLQMSRINTFPNPAKQQLSVTLDKDIKGSYTVLLLNSFGQTVFSKKYAEYRQNEVLSIDFNLPTGMYVLTVEAKEEIITSKILIQ